MPGDPGGADGASCRRGAGRGRGGAHHRRDAAGAAGGDVRAVFAGIAAAAADGLAPLTLKAVVVRGWHDRGVADLAGLTIDHPWQVRFIEIMPLDGVFEV